MRIISQHSVKVNYSAEYPAGYWMIQKSKRSGVAQAEVLVVQFDKIGIEYWNVARKLEKQGLRPAELCELLAIETYPQPENKFTIFASLLRNEEGFYEGFYPCVRHKDGNIDHGIGRFGGDLGHPYFAAVRIR